MVTADISIADNLRQVRARIERACAQFGRNPADVRLLAVSKTKPVTMIRDALACGQQDFGENYLQDALDKIPQLPAEGISWHYIGAIQSNKTRPISERFNWVHTVASEKVARRLSEQRPVAAGPLKVLVQVNISGEESKSGVAPGEVSRFVQTILQYDRLEVRGLMAIPRPETDFEQQRASFRAVRTLFDETRRELLEHQESFCDLSMGMSADLEAAVAEGATWLRIGTDIFGARE